MLFYINNCGHSVATGAALEAYVEETSVVLQF